MQLDSRIPLMGQAPQIESPQNVLMNALKTRAMKGQVDEQERQAGQRNALADVFHQPGAFDQAGNLNRSVLPSIARVAPEEVARYAGVANQQDAASMQRAKQMVEMQARLLGSVRDETTYQAAKQQYAQMGGDVSKLPPNYDPAFVEQAYRGSLSASERFDQDYKSATLDLSRRKQEHDERAPRGVVIDTADGPKLVDPRTGEGRPVTSGGVPVPPKDKGMNEGQAKANLFGNRMEEANRIIDNQSAQGIERPGQIKTIAESIPVIGGALGSLVNADPTGIIRPSAGQQQVEQAQRDFINAVLRRESGAAIAESEFDSARKQYFPALGDSAEVIAQKAANRKRATSLMLAEVPDAARQRSSAATDPDRAKPSAQVPEAAANYLRQNPALAAQFDSKYGPGAAAGILGQ